MNARIAVLCLFLAGMVRDSLAEVLIVADEFPAMEVVAARLKSEEHIDSRLVSQTGLPTLLTPFEAVVVYIHGALSETAEDAFIGYANAGGNLVLLHHSISSGKRSNRRWFSFLGVALPEGGLDRGGYKWIEPAAFDLVNLAPAHFIMTNRVTYPLNVSYTSTNTPGVSSLPAFRLEHSEVYLNHVLAGPRTVLMGLKYRDEKTGVVYVQDDAGWTKPAGKGRIVYLMPGHRKEDFENPAYARIVLNAVIYRP
ncbi:MAG TPA: ThuA domain-containing protein [Candidatus Angelobacter sp.]|nr:ThuA domain-containing protein [Candidatus Angelobacter sp.]